MNTSAVSPRWATAAMYGCTSAVRPLARILSISSRASACVAAVKRPVSRAPPETFGLTTRSPDSSGSGSPGSRKLVGTVAQERSAR